MTASNDQPCGWKIVGSRPRSASRPASPAFDEWRCTRTASAGGRGGQAPNLEERGRLGAVGRPVHVHPAGGQDVLDEVAVGRARNDDAQAPPDLVGHEVGHITADTAVGRLADVEHRMSVARPRQRLALLSRRAPRSGRSGARRCSIVGPVIDLHSHILPGIDDGVRTMDEACDLAYTAALDGVTVIAATPHVRADHQTRRPR